MKKTHTLLALLLLLPMQVHAAVDVLETVAGLTTELVVSDLPAQTDVDVQITNPDGEVTTMQLTADAQGQARSWISGNNLQVAGEYSVQAENEVTRFTVHPDTLDTRVSFLEAASKNVEAGRETLISVVAADRFGNPLSQRSIELVSSRARDTIEPLSRETDESGMQQFAVLPVEDGNMTLRAIDLISGKTLADELNLLVGNGRAPVGGPQQFYRSNPYGANLLGGSLRAQTTEVPRFDGIRIQVVGQENAKMPTLEQYKAESMILTAVDQFENPFYDFQGTVYMATTDPEAVLPLFGVYDFTFKDEGQKMLTLGLKFGTPGTQRMIISESPEEIPPCELAIACLDVNVTPQQVVKPSAKPFSIISPRAGIILNTTEITVEGKGPAFINVAIEGGRETVYGETDRDGFFAIDVSLDPKQQEHTLAIFDADDPKNLIETDFTIDITPPEFASITFAPENPTEETDVLVVVQTEPGSQDVTVTLNDETYDLMSTDPSTGKFQKLITAPEGGEYDVTISAFDPSGNIAKETRSLSVAYKSLPPVENIRAQPKPNAIALEWDAVRGEDVDAYRIYVGTSPDEFLYTLDTEKPTTAATVAGLRPGTTYHFAVTALKEGRESETSTQPVSATVLGVKLQTEPGDGSLMLTWSALQQDMPLSHFLLEYGDAPSNLTEQRILNSELRAYTLRDLVNGVQYFLKLTPITTTGEKLDALAAEGNGTPTGAGFTAGVADPVPYDLRASAPPPPTSSYPYTTTKPPVQIPLSEQGVPSWVLLATIAAAIGLYKWYLQRRKDKHMTTTFLQEMQNRYHN